jgi:hypothetical protein
MNRTRTLVPSVDVPLIGLIGNTKQNYIATG